MLLLVLTSYQVLVCPRSSWAWRIFFFFYKGYSPFLTVWRRWTNLGFRVFQKKVMKKVITHNFNIVNDLSSFFRCSRLSLTMSCHFHAPHVLFRVTRPPSSTSSPFSFFLAFFYFATDRPTGPTSGNAFDSRQKK